MAHSEHSIGNIKLSLSVEVVGIADVDLARANTVLDARRKKLKHSEIWNNTKVFTDFKEMLDATKPDCVFIGLPPLFHGQATEGKNMEVECTKRGIHFFVDKPISVQHPEQMRKDGYVDMMDKAEKSGLMISVGYMFRYSRAVSRIKEELIKHFGGKLWITLFSTLV